MNLHIDDYTFNKKPQYLYEINIGDTYTGERSEFPEFNYKWLKFHEIDEKGYFKNYNFITMKCAIIHKNYIKELKINSNKGVKWKSVIKLETGEYTVCLTDSLIKIKEE